MNEKVKKSFLWNLQKTPTETFQNINTICHESACPNKPECQAENHAAFLIGGTSCTRNCSFCNVQTGKPAPIKDIREKEAQDILHTVKAKGLSYAVITSVTRDDQPLELAAHFVDTAERIQKLNVPVEFLIPDFQLNKTALNMIANSKPSVLAHNIETVERLTPIVRNKASYKKSLNLLQYLRLNYPKIITKTGFMTGLGETMDEMEATINEISPYVDILTIGQYLPPSPAAIPVKKVYTEREFETLKNIAAFSGISVVHSGTFVRSSYRAGQAWKLATETANKKRRAFPAHTDKDAKILI